MEDLDLIQCRYGTRIEVWKSRASKHGRRLIPLAAPQAPPKHFTDEELKQQYGIHLATRLQADADGKEAKWADIDDDEDDWAPDTIEWTDGTKITLSHNDPAAQLAEEQAVAEAERKRLEEEKRAKMPPPKTTTSVGPNAKVLKLGANAPPKQGGIALKTSSDKPTLVSKPIPSAPVRSPWASLPPVDKVPPVEINPPTQIQLPRVQQGDSYPSEATQPPVPSPAMEIAADSFTRTPRDSQGGSQGQLYNSQSGRYEPVISGRRGSVRRDQNFRPPSVLQRPSQQDAPGPAEPSAAFQTQRSGSQQSGSRWERRASSTVSGGSGPQARRMSLSKAAMDAQPQHLDSQPLQSPSTPDPLQVKVSADGMPLSNVDGPPAHTTSAVPQQSQDTNQSVVSPQAGRQQLANLTATSVMHKDLDAQKEAQKQLMKEKRDLAIRRKKEEEEREEAAKKERIRKLMEAHGMEPLEKKSQQKEPEKSESEVRQVAQSEAKPEDTPALPQGAAPTTVLPDAKAPVPDASGVSSQQGMVKVHGSSLVNGITSAAESSKGEQSKAPVLDQRISPPKLDSTPRLEERLASPAINGETSKNQRGPSVPASPETRNQNTYRPQRQQPWNNVPRDSDAYNAGWITGGMTTHSASTGNLWGPPTNHKALGNGTFDRSIQRPQSRPPPYQEHHLQHTPQPIGPPKQAQRARESPDSGRTPFAGQPPAAEDFQTMPSYPSSDTQLHVTKRSNNTSRPISAEQSMPSSQPESAIQPLSQRSPERLAQGADGQVASLSAWSNFQSTSAKEDQERRQLAAQQHAVRLAEEARTGVRYEPQRPILHETWRQVKVDEQDGQRKVVSVAKGPNQSDSLPTHQIANDLRIPSLQSPAHIGPLVSSGRGSRFFPIMGQGFQNQQRAASYTAGYNRSPSPPPPDSIHHPAYARNQQHPLVNLPIMKPKPTVKLPPAMVSSQSAPGLTDARAAPLRAVSQPLVKNPSWQDRFDGLLGVKKPTISPEQKSAEVAGFSETKVPLELPSEALSAAVSLPSKEDDRQSPNISLSVFSKAVEQEEALFEEREFGSTPTVNFPIPDSAWQKPKQSKHSKAKRGSPKAIHPISKEPFILSLVGIDEQIAKGLTLFINIPGMGFPKSKTLPPINATSIYYNGGRGHRNFSGNQKSHRGGRLRDSSGHHSGQKPTTNVPSGGQTDHPPNAQGRGSWSKGHSHWANQRVPNVA